MWNKDGQTEVPGMPQSKDTKVPGTTMTPLAGNRPGIPAARNLACLGATIVVKGEITSDEDLQIDGRVEGPISLRNSRLIVGRSAQLNSEITAREVIVYGNASGNLRALDRVEIKKDGQVIGNITTARISVEDGAYFKGRIEIDRSQAASQESRKESEVSVGNAAD